jgi:hypothetical protein
MLYKVKDLIKALGKFDPDSYVGHRVPDDGYVFVQAISGITEREVYPEELGLGFCPCQCNMVIIDEMEEETDETEEELE